MRVKEVMTRQIETIEPEALAMAANEQMWRQQIHHLVVMEGERMVGMISDTDLGGGDAKMIPDTLRVREVMTAPVVMVEVHEPLERARSLMKNHRIRCLVVVEEGDFVGILTATDLETVEKRGTAHPPFEGGDDPHQGPYIQLQERETHGTSKHHHTDWPGF